ncbi:MAG: prefoldin subunit alpha [Methanomicrobiales archaeon]|nr:prefoldin subunit alpha [Methanomicrobiales archaeon]
MVSKVDEADPREVQALQTYLQEYGQQAEVLSRQLEFMERQRMESLAAIDALKALAAETEGVILVPMGGGTTLRARIIDPDNVLVNIGADVVIRRKNEEAIGFIEDRVKELESLEKRVSDSLDQVRGQINELARRIDQAYRKAQAR